MKWQLSFVHRKAQEKTLGFTLVYAPEGGNPIYTEEPRGEIEFHIEGRRLFSLGMVSG
jgi:hypothetical protein